MTLPRRVADRDVYYLRLATLVATRSKDPSTQVGCVIVSVGNEPLGTGYNGPPRQIDDDAIDWSRPVKYSWMHHAESNALWFGRRGDLDGASLYCTHLPCERCMLDIVRAGITRVVCVMPDDGEMLDRWSDSWARAREIAEHGGVWIGYVTRELVEGSR